MQQKKSFRCESMSQHSLAFEVSTNGIPKSILRYGHWTRNEWNFTFRMMYEGQRVKAKGNVFMFTFYMMLYHLNISGVPYNWLRIDAMQLQTQSFFVVVAFDWFRFGSATDLLEQRVIRCNRCWYVLVCVSTVRTISNWFSFHFLLIAWLELNKVVHKWKSMHFV